MRRYKSRSAFTLVEMLMVIALVGILSVAGIGLYTNSLDDARFDATYKEMLQIRKGLIGDLENTTIEGERTRFGYLGDMGGIPTTSQGLIAIYSRPSGVSAWDVDDTANIGVGWNGPYVTAATDVDTLKDAWNNNYIYVANVSIPYILSLGSDGAPGGTGTAQDIQVDIPLDIRSSTVNGQIVNSGSVYSGSAYVQLYYPSATGAIASMTAALSSGNNGQFTFSNVPFGVRSVKIQVPNSAAPAITVGPVVVAIDNNSFFLPSNRMELNPTNASANCNSIANTAYVPGSIVRDDNNDRVSFQLNINRAYSINNLYVSSSNNTNKLEKIGIGGIVYGCFGALGAAGGILLDRSFDECTPSSKDVNLQAANGTLNLNNAWGIPSGVTVEAFMDFKNHVSGMTYIDMRLGCDQFRISCGTGYHDNDVGNVRYCVAN